MLSNERPPKLHTFLVYLLVACITIQIWMIVVFLMDYLLVVKWFVVYELSRVLLIAVLFGIILLTVTFINILFKCKSKQILVLTFLLGITMLSTGYYHQKVINYQKEAPRIKVLSKDWSIQGDVIRISGANFGHIKGKVKIGNLEFTVVSWKDSEVRVEQPVPPEYVIDNLVICNFQGRCSDGVPFAIRDPAEVL